MSSYDKLFGEIGFTDWVTHTSFMLFIILREYISALSIQDSMEMIDSPVVVDNKIKFYMYLYDMLKEQCTNPFECLNPESDLLSKHLQALTRGRIERLRNTFEAVLYTHITPLKESVFPASKCIEMDDKFIVTKDSVFGLFLRRFAIGFHSLTFPEMTNFLDSFFRAYESNVSSQYGVSTVTEFDALTRNHALEESSKIIEAIGKLADRKHTDVEKYDEFLNLVKSVYSELSTPHYASHLLAVQKRNFTEAERELHAYFETCASSSSSELNLNNTSAYVAIAAAAMHLSFGHWSKGKCLEKEALQKALESDSKAPLSHVKIAHTLLNGSTEPFRYGGQLSHRRIPKSPNVALADYRTRFWDMLDTGSAPNALMLHYFDTPFAASPNYFVVCLLDLAVMWSFFGYPILSTTLLQCVVNADCLEPCSSSDTVLTTAFASLIKEFNAVGSVNLALQLYKSCEAVLSKFSEKSMLLQASLEVELEQCLRSGHDLVHCDRLVNALRLCCPWEAALSQAEVERKRGNLSLCHDLLQHIADSASTRRANQSSSKDPSKRLPLKCSHSTSDLPFGNREPFSHCIFHAFPDQVPVGGLAKLAQIELRAHVALAELFMSLNLSVHAQNAINSALNLGKQMNINLGTEIAQLMAYANESTCSTNLQLDDVISEILHRASRLTQIRCKVFASRIRLKNRHNKSSVESFLPLHLEMLSNALAYYRQLDHRKGILDILALTAATLHAMNRHTERNEMANLFNLARQQMKFTANPGRKDLVIEIL